MNDHSVYRDLIATQKPAHILRLSAASEQPGVDVLLPETLPFFPLFFRTASPSSLLILFPAPLSLSHKFIYLYPPPTHLNTHSPFLFFCMCSDFPGNSAAADVCLLFSNQTGAHSHTHVNTHAQMRLYAQAGDIHLIIPCGLTGNVYIWM